MAEVIAAEIIKAVFQKLGDEALKQYVRSKGIQSELKNLEKTLSEIQTLLADASEKENGDKDVKQWLNSLQHLAYDIDDILDGLATDAVHCELNQESGVMTTKVTKLIPTCCTNFKLSNQLSHKLDSIATKLQALLKKKKDLGLIEKDERPKYNTRINETSLLEPYVVGRQDEKNKLLQKLLLGADEPFDQKISLVPIVGMGGVGKTTLARFLYNDPQVKDHFQIRAWVCVSDDFDVFKISKTILQDLSGESKKFENLNQVQMAIIEQLKKGRFLLVLDDVWTERYDDWESLARPFQSCAFGSRVIITARKVRLLEQLGYDHLDQLASLSHDDALSLFAYHALDVHNFDSYPTLKRQGEGFVNKCGCLPLALKAIGRLLRTNTNVERWEEVLNSEIWDLENNEIVPALRLSYHDLPAILKQLFAYCSLFPKDFLFDKDDLVLLWMAEGFLSQSTSNKPAEHFGHDYFDMLLSRSFFQQAPNDKSLYVMHDLMHDLAIFVAGDYFLSFDNLMEIENEDLTKYRHMSFIREGYVAYQKFESFRKAKRLRTFLAVALGVETRWESFFLSNKILVDLLPNLRLLRVLCLSGFKITKVQFIGSLKHLRYLNLSQTKIGELPENVCNLYNLETLILFGCANLSKLPTSFIKLKKLRHFDIRDTPLLKKMPLGIGELNMLQTLPKIIIGGDDGFAITELKNLKNLHGKTSIEGLDTVQNRTYAHDIKFSEKRLTELELKWSNVFDGSRNETIEKQVFNELKPHSDKLKRLEIRFYGGAEFPNWVGDPSYRQLVHVSIYGCRKCTSLPSLAQLPCLKELYIEDMNEVKVVSLTGVAFPSLEILHFKDLDGWEVWSSNSGVGFPRLREFVISGCPNLVEVSFESLPSLRVVKIIECGNGVLRSIVRAAPSVTKLEIDNILGLSDEAWKDVMMYLGAVEELMIRDCKEIRYLWESEAEVSKVLVNLRTLGVYGCSKLVSLGEKEEVEEEEGSNLLLTSLIVKDCESMKHCICGNSIQSLIIDRCRSMTSIICGNSIQSLITGCRSMTCVWFPDKGGEEQKHNNNNNLKSLYIWNCEKLMIKELGGEQNNSTSVKMGMLESVFTHRWENLKSMNELSYSIHLTLLSIRDCPNLESMPNRELVNLTSLRDMTIRNCPNMDVCFPGGYWPPNLSSLGIGELKKPISEWGNQNFPTSLVQLRLYARGDDEGCSNSSQLSTLVPSSLTKLEIKGFKKLEKGLQHLTSLQHLRIYQCPKIKDLPETLLPSLLSLKIWDCPKLKKRCSGKGWSRISHIPEITLH